MTSKRIKQPVTLTGEQAETIYKVSNSILHLVETAEAVRPGDPFPVWTLEVLAEKLLDTIEENGSFVFEDTD